MKLLRALTRRLRRQRHTGTLQIDLTADVTRFGEAMRHAEEQTHRLLRSISLNSDLAWIRTLAANELAAGRHHVSRLTGQAYTDLGLARPLVTRHDRKDPS